MLPCVAGRIKHIQVTGIGTMHLWCKFALADRAVVATRTEMAQAARRILTE